MSDQLTYNGRFTKPISVQMPRGEDRFFPFEHLAGPSTTIKEAYFKITQEDTDVVVLTLEDHPTQWNLATPNYGVVWIKHANTVGLDAGQSFRVAVEFVMQDDTHYTPVIGTYMLQDDVINDNETAPYLTWQTRKDFEDTLDSLEDLIEGLKTCNNVTTLSAAAAASDTSITVDNGEVCPANSVIRIMLNNDNYDERTVNTQVGDVLTFTGGLSYAADAGKAVRRT